MGVETSIALVILGIIITFFAGIILYILLLRKMARENKIAYVEYAKNIITGMAGGLTVLIAMELKGINLLTLDGISLFFGILFLVFAVIVMGGSVVIYLLSKNRSRSPEMI